MVGYILASEDETIAVIAGSVTPTEDELDEFYVKVRTALAEHYCCGVEDVCMNDIVNWDKWTFEGETYEDGDYCIRDFTLTQTAIYL